MCEVIDIDKFDELEKRQQAINKEKKEIGDLFSKIFPDYKNIFKKSIEIFQKVRESMGDKNFVISPFGLIMAEQLFLTISSNQGDVSILEKFHEKMNNDKCVFVSGVWQVGNENKIICDSKLIMELVKTINHLNVNNRIKKATNDIVNNVVDPSVSLMDFLIVNVLHFESKWMKKFEKEDEKIEFNVSNNEKIKVDYMRTRDYLNIYSTNQFSGVVVPYDERYSFIIIVPNKKYTLDLETAIDKLLNAKEEEVILFTPKFTMSNDIDLTKIVKEDLPSFYGYAKQNTKIIVNEEGTKATSCTIMPGIKSAEYKPEPTEFIVDKPFIFVIWDSWLKVPLFMGYVKRPFYEE